MGKVAEAPMTEDSYEILSTEPILEKTGNQEDLSTTEEGYKMSSNKTKLAPYERKLSTIKLRIPAESPCKHQKWRT